MSDTSTLEACYVTSTPGAVPPSVSTRLGDLPLSVVSPERFDAWLAGRSPRQVAVVLASTPSADELPPALDALSRHGMQRTRVFLVAPEGRWVPADGYRGADVEELIAADALGQQLPSVLERGLRAFQAIGDNPLVPKNYLDSTYNDIFDWFEKTRWDWSELGEFGSVDTSLLSEQDVETLKESAVIEFGTLPGAHNFLREWADEYSFSSWALAWGAEEARHSLVQCRYLKHIGIEIPAKHAMYKREPYPMGRNRAGTLMMNIISEARAATYYRVLSQDCKEPTLKRIWKLLGADEARHARAFKIFCQEMCRDSRESRKAALEMAYVFLADRQNGVKHPAGYFYPHSTSTDGLRRTEKKRANMTDDADKWVLAMTRDIVGDPSINSISTLKASLRSYV